MSSPDAVVVGGGAVGLCSALELARAGASVCVVERDAELAAGCSAGNAGLVCPSHAAPLASRSSLRLGLRSLFSREGPLAVSPRPALAAWLVRFAAASAPAREQRATRAIRGLVLASDELHRALASELGTGLEPRGTLNVFETEAGLEAGLHEAAAHEAAGVHLERLAPADARALEPALTGEIAGALYYPGELNGDPAAFVRAVGRAAADAGVTLSLATSVRQLVASGGRVTAVDTDGGRIDAGAVVLAAGSWTPQLARGVGVHVPVEAGKGYHVDLPGGPGDPRLPVFVYESRVVATALPGRLRLTGVLALSGLDLSLDERRIAAIVRVGERRVAGIAGRRRLETWAGLRPCSPDGLPIIGRASAIANVYLATGHGMLGLALAPITGRVVAQLVTGVQPELDLSPYDPARFG